MVTNKLNIIFWSGSGNTEAMAEYILEGCPYMGDEEADRLKALGEKYSKNA